MSRSKSTFGLASRVPLVVLPRIVLSSTNSGRIRRLAQRLLPDANVVAIDAKKTIFNGIDCEPAAIIVDLVGCQSVDSAATELTRIWRVFPHIALIAYTDTRASSAALGHAEGLGVMAVVFVSAEEHPEIEYRTICHAQADFIARVVVGGLLADSWLRRLTSGVVSRAFADLTVPELCGILGMPYWRLRLRLARNGLPGAHELVTWGRVVVAAWVLEHRFRGVERLAEDLGWRNDVPLAEAVKAHLGLTPSGLHSIGSFERAKSMFIEAVTKGEFKK